MSSMIRLSSTCMLEMGEVYTQKITQKELYAYKFDKNIQLLNADGFINDRDKSYCPYYQNVLMKRTPYPFFTEEFHDASKCSPLVSIECPALEYQKATINFASGYFYAPTDYLSGIRLYYIVDGVKNFTVCSLIDERTASRIKANHRNVVLDNTVFNASFDIELLNVSQLFNSSDKDIKTLRDYLFGLGTHTCSELFIEQFVVENAQVMDFRGREGYTFKRFFVEDINKQFYTKQELSEELFVSFQKDEENTCLTMKLLHTKYDVEQYLEKKLTDADTWQIEYELTTTAYNFDGRVLGSNSIQLQNFSNQFTEISYRPIILNEWMNPESGLETDKIDHCVFDVRCIAKTSLAQLEIVRYAQIVETNPEIFYIPRPIINMVSPTVYSKKTVVTHEVKMPTDLPNIVKIIQPYYVIGTIGKTITLTPYDTPVSIDVSNWDLSQSKDLVLKFDAREYRCVEIINNKSAIFNIPATECLKATKNWYLFDGNNKLITYGDINRLTS